MIQLFPMVMFIQSLIRSFQIPRHSYYCLSSSRKPALLAVNCRQRASHSTASGLTTRDEYFSFTRGRFVCNETEESSLRYLHFDIDALTALAAKAVGSSSCVEIEKYPDGMYNKAFLLTMNDGTQVVAKLPNPNAGAPHFTTASEVATMEFMRETLKTPVPKVYAWNSRAKEDNKVGAEYIIMEKLAGAPLEDRWADMEISDQFKLVKTIAGYQKAWMSASFNQFGSLYYARDLSGCNKTNPLYIDQNGDAIVDERFAVGPSTGRELSDDGRASISFDRGPWSSLEDYLSAIGHREMACVKNVHRLPKSPVGLYGPGTYQPTREKKLKAIEAYLKIFKYLCPTDQSITSPCLWHGDLHIGNILVNPDNPTEVVGIIDWQSTELAPLFYHARQPHLLDYDGPPIEGLERPHLPKNMESLNPDEQRAARALYHKQSLSALYKTLVNKQNPRLYRALEYQAAQDFNFLLLARNLLVDGEATYLAQVVELEKAWAALPSVVAHGGFPFPFSFSDEEVAKIESDMNGALNGMNAMQGVKDSLGDLFPEQGVVPRERYDEAKDALSQAKEFIIETFASNDREKEAWERAWPFDS